MSTSPVNVAQSISLLNPGRSASLDEPLVRMREAIPVDPGGFGAGVEQFDEDPTPPPTYQEFLASTTQILGQDWFDRIHVLPRFFAFGNILAPSVRGIDIYNAYLYESRTFEDFVNNAGEGTEITDLPSLPHIIPAQRSLLLTLEVESAGAPTIDTTLDFVFSSETIQVPITGTRIVVFPFEPEAPLVERLQFLTDVLMHKDGTEQRVSLRKAPRQVFDMTIRREDGPERQRLDFTLFDWQNRVFGLPIWTEPTFLTVAAAAGHLELNVADTTLSDFREGGMAIVYIDETTFDIVEVESVTSTLVTINSPLLGDYPVGTRVLPLRTAVTTEAAREKRYAVNLADFDLTMRVLDNDVDLSDLTGWPTYQGKVLLSDANAITHTLDGLIDRNIRVIDSEAGVFRIESTWDRPRRSSAKTFISQSRTRLWQVRRLLHALRGRQVSFYLPTFSKDLSLASLYLSGAAALTIHNVGYTRFVRQRTPKMDIRIILTNGTVFTRTITGSSEVDSATEQVTLSSSIAQNISPEEVRRIEFIEKVRIDNDEIVIEHISSNGEARIGFPVKVVLE